LDKEHQHELTTTTKKQNQPKQKRNSDVRANSQPRKRYSRHFAFKGRGRKRHGAIKSRNERVSTRPARRIK
jgi:hypothetical protein